jgi:hypothetical protein
MTRRVLLVLVVAATGVVLPFLALPTPACCPAGPKGQPVVNADQEVIILWDAATKTQHFIRRASFKSEAADFGFLIPTPAQPELEESGNEAFPLLKKLTAPRIVYEPRPRGTKDFKKDDSKDSNGVVVLQEKVVAGYLAKVLEAGSATALVDWLKDNGYFYSTAVEAWAAPYVKAKWKFTALKLIKGEKKAGLTASALRLTFKTEHPVFPYREPDSRDAAQALSAKKRLLRIYFLAEARYAGNVYSEPNAAGTSFGWPTRTVAWAGTVSPANRKELLRVLRLPQKTGPEQLWLTEFEDNWPYRVAPGDLYFSVAREQETVRRPPIVVYRD